MPAEAAAEASTALLIARTESARLTAELATSQSALTALQQQQAAAALEVRRRQAAADTQQAVRLQLQEELFRLRYCAF